MKITQPIQNTKLAICIPCREQLHAVFTYNLVKLVQYCNKIKLHIELFMQTGSLISRQRQQLASTAIEAESTHILWLDTDMTFPPTIAEVLLSHNVEVVACNYSTRSTPLKGVAYTNIGDWDSYINPTNIVPRLQSVEGVGMGCMLTKTSIFSHIEKPWFEVSWVDEYNDFIGEDFYFCSLVKNAGFPVMIDTIISQKIKHIGTCEFGLIETSYN